MSSFTLKIIACVTMFIDHLGAVFPSYFPYIFRSIGRMAFPIYVYLIAEGCKYTKNIWKYLKWLGIFALVSEILFDVCFNSSRSGFSISFLDDTNVFYTLFLGVLAVAEFDIIKEWIEAKDINVPKNDLLRGNKYMDKAFRIILCIPALIPAFGCMFLANLLGTDYGMKGVFWITAVYICRTKLLKVICVFVGVVYLYGMNILQLFYRCLVNLDFTGISKSFGNMRNTYLSFGFAFLTVVLLALYNGKRGGNIKWFFYIFYPAHLFLLTVSRVIITK